MRGCSRDTESRGGTTASYASPGRPRRSRMSGEWRDRRAAGRRPARESAGLRGADSPAKISLAKRTAPEPPQPVSETEPTFPQPRPPRPPSPWRLSVAPMMDWTDSHCRRFHRLLTRRTRLYTEMVTTGALLHGDVPRHLDFDTVEHPLALQLGGSEPADLAACTRLAVRWGYDEINLNCGCPSERVQRGAFGACLMAEPALVADCVSAMVDAADGRPVTVKHRIGIDRTESYGFVRDFIGTVADAGCGVFIVHARNAWLQGLSPKENRELPPLRYGLVHRLKAEFAELTIVINGGLCERRRDRRSVAPCRRRDGRPPCVSRSVGARRLGPALLRRRRSGDDARTGRSRLGRRPRGTACRRRAVAACHAPCARAVERQPRRPPLAPGVVRPSAEDSSTVRRAGAGDAGSRQQAADCCCGGCIGSTWHALSRWRCLKPVREL